MAGEPLLPRSARSPLLSPGRRGHGRSPRFLLSWACWAQVPLGSTCLFKALLSLVRGRNSEVGTVLFPRRGFLNAVRCCVKNSLLIHLGDSKRLRHDARFRALRGCPSARTRFSLSGRTSVYPALFLFIWWQRFRALALGPSDTSGLFVAQGEETEMVAEAEGGACTPFCLCALGQHTARQADQQVL